MKGRLLAELGDMEAAARAYKAALGCPCSDPERRLLQRRLEALQIGDVTWRMGDGIVG